MSRSYKHHPFVKDGSPSHRRHAKRYMNHVVRQFMKTCDDDSIPMHHKGYRKLGPSYYIHDYWFMGDHFRKRTLWHEEHGWRVDWIRRDDDWELNDWLKCYYRK